MHDKTHRKMEKLVIYHAECLDGFTAAWAASLALGRGPDVEYFPAKRGSSVRPDCAGKEVYILDFSYDRATLKRMHSEASSPHRS